MYLPTVDSLKEPGRLNGKLHSEKVQRPDFEPQFSRCHTAAQQQVKLPGQSFGFSSKKGFQD
jgi:hypothetical protein